MIPAAKAVFFDFGGTLDSDGIAWRPRFKPIYESEGVFTAPERFDRAFYDADDGLPARFRLDGLGLEDTVRLQVACVLENLAGGDGWDRRVRDRVAARFLADSRRHFQRNRPMLERLAGRFRLGIVSNNYGNMESMLESEGLRDLFEVVADSEKVGAVKPDRRIFDHALGALALRPSQVWMVGDSKPRDMKGAEALGMPHAWLAGPGGAEEPCCPGAPVLKTLPDLEAVLAEAAAR